MSKLSLYYMNTGALCILFCELKGVLFLCLAELHGQKTSTYHVSTQRDENNNTLIINKNDANFETIYYPCSIITRATSFLIESWFNCTK